MKRENFFTDTTAKRLYINLRDSLGVTGKKDPLKHSDESIKLEISFRDVTPFNLDITMTGQSFLKFVYEQGSNGNIVSLFEYRIVKGDKDKKLEEYANNFRLYRKRKLIRFDQEISRRNKSGRKTCILKRRLATPKSVKFGNTQFKVRYERSGTNHLRCR